MTRRFEDAEVCEFSDSPCTSCGEELLQSRALTFQSLGVAADTTACHPHELLWFTPTQQPRDKLERLASSLRLRAPKLRHVLPCQRVGGAALAERLPWRGKFGDNIPSTSFFKQRRPLRA